MPRFNNDEATVPVIPAMTAEQLAEIVTRLDRLIELATPGAMLSQIYIEQYNRQVAEQRTLAEAQKAKEEPAT